MPPVPDLILHQYEISPFSEKIRRILAWKKIRWTAVRAPAVMPKPDLVALTGGYRRIPVLQIGNHVYCDTSLIARVLERVSPEPALYPEPMAESLAEWADAQLFLVASIIGMRPTRLEDSLRWLTQDELSKIMEDRKAMRAGAPRPMSFEIARGHLGAYLARLDAHLASRTFLLGDAPCIADFAVYHSAWFLERMAPEPLLPFAALGRWMERIAAPVWEPASTIDALEAIRVAHDAGTTFHSTEPVDPTSPLAAGDRAVVRALDYGRDPIDGELVHASSTELVLKREDARAGKVFAHFPRIGFGIERAG